MDATSRGKAEEDKELMATLDKAVDMLERSTLIDVKSKQEVRAKLRDKKAIGDAG
jgi:hypothetical protein